VAPFPKGGRAALAFQKKNFGEGLWRLGQRPCQRAGALRLLFKRKTSVRGCGTRAARAALRLLFKRKTSVRGGGGLAKGLAKGRASCACFSYFFGDEL
jgi:hypothetical protein